MMAMIEYQYATMILGRELILLTVKREIVAKTPYRAAIMLSLIKVVTFSMPLPTLVRNGSLSLPFCEFVCASSCCGDRTTVLSFVILSEVAGDSAVIGGIDVGS